MKSTTVTRPAPIAQRPGSRRLGGSYGPHGPNLTARPNSFPSCSRSREIARRLNPLMGNGKGVVGRVLGGTCGPLGDSCGRPELPRRDADEPLEVPAEL